MAAVTNGTMTRQKTPSMTFNGSIGHSNACASRFTSSSEPQKKMQMDAMIRAMLTPIANSTLARLSARSIASAVVSGLASSMARWIGPICSRSSCTPCGYTESIPTSAIHCARSSRWSANVTASTTAVLFE